MPISDAMEQNDSVFVAGHRGLVGSALVRSLKRQGFRNLLLRTRTELDLTHAEAVVEFFNQHRPKYVFLAAAKVGGIHANRTSPADFLRLNLAIQGNVFDGARVSGAAKLLFLGSSCIYPKLCPQPMKEEHLLTGALEPTNEAYAIAKISGVIGCRAYNQQYGTRFVAAMPTNLYGPGDNFDLQTSHVLPAMIRKFDQAKREHAPRVELWGTGSPRREFLYSDDLADACVHLMRHFEPTADRVFLNVGVGQDLTIKQLAEIVRDVVGYSGEICWNHEMPDGTPRKLLDVSQINELGWAARTPLRQGVEQTYAWFQRVQAGNAAPTE